MEREIKFRAKSKATNKFVYGIPIKTHIGTYMVYEENPHVCSMYGYMEIDEFELIDENTLCQFTGLKDKNDIEMYDGDIINIYRMANKYNVISKVEYVSSSFQVKDMWPLSKYAGKCEVIGNIYDNPELIK